MFSSRLFPQLTLIFTLPFLSYTALGKPELDDQQKREIQKGIVVIKGPNGSGTGFITNIQDATVVVTNIHVLGCMGESGGISFRTIKNTELSPTAIFGAKGHDIAIVRFEEEDTWKETALPFTPGIEDFVNPNQSVTIPGNAKGGGTVVWTTGTIQGIGPDRIEHTAPTYSGNSGSPIIHSETLKVIGVETYGATVSLSDKYDQHSFQNKDSAIKSEIRNFGYRLDSPSDWYQIDLGTYRKQWSELESFKKEFNILYSFFFEEDSTEWKQHPQLILAVKGFWDKTSSLSTLQTSYAGSTKWTDYYQRYWTIHPVERERIGRMYKNAVNGIILSRKYHEFSGVNHGHYDYFSGLIDIELNKRKWLMGWIDHALKFEP